MFNCCVQESFASDFMLHVEVILKSQISLLVVTKSTWPLILMFAISAKNRFSMTPPPPARRNISWAALPIAAKIKSLASSVISS